MFIEVLIDGEKRTINLGVVVQIQPAKGGSETKLIYLNGDEIIIDHSYREIKEIISKRQGGFRYAHPPAHS